MPASGAAMWRRRVGLRYALVLATLLLPPLIAFVATGAPLLLATGMLAVAAIYLAFWFGLCLAIGARIAASATNAAALVGCWIALTLLLPTLANAAIVRAVPVGKGIELTLAQREVVHKGWDVPKAATFDKFLVNHPEYRGREAFKGRFHWKWYYAIHQVGDEAVAPQVAAYRKSLEERERSTARAGWLLPSVATQVLLHRLADTDLAAQTAYWDSIAAFHDVLRRFFYPYLFNDRPFTAADFANLPGYRPRASTAGWPAGSTAALLLVTLIVLAIGAVQARRMGAPERVAH
jgi:ABC-2 type transport system permease protein